MGYSRNGGTAPPAADPPRDQGSKNPPVFTREIWTPSGIIQLAVFEKPVGKNKDRMAFFACVSRRYQKENKEWETTDIMNPQDLLIAADLFKIAWDFCLENSNRQ